jgi:peptide deformylase
MDSNSNIPPAEIIRIGHPALRHGTRLVSQELFNAPVLYELIEVMRATLAEQGVGLAAPQIAVPLRLFVVEGTEAKMSHLSPEQRRVGTVILIRPRRSSIRSGTRPHCVPLLCRTAALAFPAS